MVGQDAFGRTGHRSSRTIFGGASLSRVTQDAADRTLEVLLRHGVNHIDVAASYGDAELRVAPWLKREPGRFFIATKTDAREKEAARDELHQRIERVEVMHRLMEKDCIECFSAQKFARIGRDISNRHVAGFSTRLRERGLADIDTRDVIGNALLDQ